MIFRKSIFPFETIETNSNPGIIHEELTRVNSNYEPANDEHLKRFCRLAQGQKQSSDDSEAVIQQQGSLSKIKKRFERERQH